jgi:hypothetical protein
MDLTDPGDPELLPDVGEMIYARSARKTPAQDEGGSAVKRKKGRREVGSKPKQPRARAKAEK